MIAWILILKSLILLLVSIVGPLITLVSGIAMLKGQNWARLLYVGWGIIDFVTDILISPIKAAMIPRLIFFAAITFFLFRSKADEFFLTRDSSLLLPPNSDVGLMIPPASMPTTQIPNNNTPPKRCRRIIFALSYNLTNIISLILCVHLASIAGESFGEFIVRSFIGSLSLILFCVGITLSFILYFKQYHTINSRFVYFFICSLIAMLLAFFAVLGVMDACENDKGYCRHWQIVAVAPSIALNTDMPQSGGTG